MLVLGYTSDDDIQGIESLKGKCATCLFLAHEDDKEGYVCHNEASECYGKVIEDYRAGSCGLCQEHNYDYSIKEILELIPGTK